MYSTAVKSLGRIPIKLPTHSSDDFCLTISDIERAVSKKTKLLIINSPENPTGAVYNRELIRDIHSFAQKQNIYFVHDEVYDAFVFEGVHENIFRHQNGIDSHSIIINSFSKKYAMMGWRLGWIIGCKEFIDNATKFHTNLTLNLGSLHQEAAASILNDLEVEKGLQQHVMNIKRNVLSLKQQLLNGTSFGLNASTPKGAFFLFPNVTKLFSKIPNEYKTANTKGEAVAQYLLKECKVAVVPGVIYGQHGSDYIRIAATVQYDKIVEAGERLLLTEKIPNAINI